MHRLGALIPIAILAACSHNIGDSCTTNVDCDPQGTRYCDVAEPGGYCTIQGCEATTCPSEAVCIRFFDPIPTEACNPEQPETADGGCLPSERCLCDCGDPKLPGVCDVPGSENGSASDGTLVVTCANESLTASTTDGSVPDYLGHCAPESSERRWCQKKCSSNGDCRSGYECRRTGIDGAESIPDETVGDAGIPAGPVVKFCVRAS